ncbi:helix-turn-helix domain-containing protein [Bradyrhizobium sp. 156]|uniref:helix-turn-helix domain-containing protein n=1 Tax=Bradyrhizobium sp. 156 TaxID=2782630 RepID=UPI001FF93DEA|nr:helix-turn-helix domain-containing protein [Bradyrhizobium sp. 156]MCK1326128.1 helix-turn-helix domain-containing protein [Bradyrhizobium sp. 156]
MKSLTSGISTTKAAARLGVTPQTVRRWCETGFGFRLGGRWRISENRIAEIERSLSNAGTGMPPFRAPQPF